jgi:6-pyruvoyltetrahydropterin/6-carboxytetrahydropterin synthase
MSWSGGSKVAGRYRVSVEGHFDAAHYLRGYGGKCEALHGHRFRVVVEVAADRLDKIGLAYDFSELKKHLAAVTARFDHTCLNDIPPFDRINPSSENIAATIYEGLGKRLTGAPVSLVSVSVWESPESSVTYLPA